jgi:coenzyme F420-dependent glucose-6-phosphate dehydrogenase
MTGLRIYYGATHEQFSPVQLLRHAILAEQVGFDGISSSDHFHPWVEGGEAGQAWVWLGAACQATRHVRIGTGVTPAVHRYHPALVAPAGATLEVMFPGRIFLGVGSGEALNESPFGLPWPALRERVDCLEESLEIIRRLSRGEELSFDGTYHSTSHAKLYTRPAVPAPIYVSSFGKRSAGIAARLGDGVITLADPAMVRPVLDAYRAAAADAGKPEGEIILLVSFSWADNEDAAFEGARGWKASLPKEFYAEDWHQPDLMERHATATISDDELRRAILISSDPAEHVARIREVIDMGATILILNNVSGADPEAALRMYGSKVLPHLRA